MNYPELLAIPILMLADYALTILGAKSSAKVYRNHFKVLTYELNPLWRKSVDQIRWYNPRHLCLVALFTASLVAVDRIGLRHDAVRLLLGMLLGGFGTVCGRHIANLLIFHFVNHHTSEISGQVQMSMKLMLKTSQFQYVGLIPIFAIVASFAPSPFTIGVLLGVLSLVFAHFCWLARTESEGSIRQQAELLDAEPSESASHEVPTGAA